MLATLKAEKVGSGAQPSATQPADPSANGAAATSNKFFRSNRVSGAELKKRDYVAKELQAGAQAAAHTRAPRAKLEPTDSYDASNAADGSAENFMAGMGVVSKQGPKKRQSGAGRKSRATKEPVEQPEEQEDEEDELDDVSLSSKIKPAP